MQKAKIIIYLLMLVLGILGIINTIGLSLYTNVNVGTLIPGFAGLVIFIYVGLKLWIFKNRPIIKNKIFRNLIQAGLILFILSFVVIESLIIYNSGFQENIRTDYLIILGAGVNGKTVSLTLKERLDKGIDYLNQNPGTRVVVSGGKGFGEEITEAEAMKKYLVECGISSSRIIMEDKSTSTMENFKFSKKVLSDIRSQDNTKIMIITSDFHMLRAKMLAQRNGFEAYGITCGTPISVRLNSYAREYFAFIKSLIIDR